MGKSTISMAIFHCYVSSPGGIGHEKSGVLEKCGKIMEMLELSLNFGEMWVLFAGRVWIFGL